MTPATMVVVTFNIQHGRRPDGVVDVAALASCCASFGADVLALQEVDDLVERSGELDLAAVVAEACAMTWVFGPATTLGRRGRYGNALLVRGDIDDVEVVPLPHSPSEEPRCAIVARAQVAARGVGGGMSTSIAVTHLGIRGEAPAQVPVLVAALMARPGPRLLLGDLNLTAPDVAPLQLVDAPPAFPASRPRRAIDHVAVDGLRATAVSVLPRQPVSDHRPLRVDVASA